MPILSREDNKNLFKSNLPEDLKYQIASFNELIMAFFKENFQTHEGYEELIKKIKETYPKVEYKIEPLANGGACLYYERNGKELKYTFAISPHTLNNLSAENGLIGIYFHEFFHLITKIADKEVGTRIDEGMADLFSDAVVNYFNESFAKEEILQYKKSGYFIPASIVRSACVKSNIVDYIWYYLTNNDKYFEIYKERFGEKIADQIFSIDNFSSEFNFLAEIEEKGIKKAIKRTDISDIPAICLIQNNIAIDIICQEIETSGLTEKQARKKYPNLPDDFFKENQYIFSKENKKRLGTIYVDIDRTAVDEFANYFVSEIIDSFKTPNQNVFCIHNILHKIKKHQRILKLDIQTIIPVLYAYYLKYNNFEYNEKVFKKALIEFGYEEETLFDKFNIIFLKTKQIFEKFKNLTIEEAYQKVREIILLEIKNNITEQALEQQFKDEKITLEDYLSQIINHFKKTKNEIYTPLILINSYIKKYAKEKSKTKKLDVNNFNKIKNHLESVIKELGIENEIDLVSSILISWNLENESLPDALEIIATYGLKRMNTSDVYEAIKLRGVSNLINEMYANLTDVNQEILKCLRFIATDNFIKSISFYEKGGIFRCQKTKVIKIFYKLIEHHMHNILASEELNKEDYRNVVIFLTNLLSEQVKEEDKEILQEIFEIEDITDQSYSVILLENDFNPEIYNKLKVQPVLAAMYHACFIPDPTREPNLVSLQLAISDMPSEADDFLKKEYKSRIEQISKSIIEKGYPITEQDLLYYSLEYEFDILKSDFRSFLDEKTIIQLMLKIIEICNIKIPILLAPETKTCQDKKVLFEEMKKNVEEIIATTQNQIIKTELQKLLDNLSTYSMPDRG